MSAAFQLTIDCADPGRLVEFWANALPTYRVEPPPGGAATWNEHWRSIGVPDAELDPDRDNADSLTDPLGQGPRIWFQQVPEVKSIKNRLHLDLLVGGGRTVPLPERRARVLAEEQRLIAAGASRIRVLEGDGVDHFGVVLADPEGNEFCLA